MSLRDLFPFLSKKKRNSSDANTENTDSVDNSFSGSVRIDATEYDSNDVIESLNYAIDKYGKAILDDAFRLKSILADLAPRLGKECKILEALCKGHCLRELLDFRTWKQADLELWANKSVVFLSEEELIDKRVAANFITNLTWKFSGRMILITCADGNEGVGDRSFDKDVLAQMRDLQRNLEEKEEAQKVADEKVLVAEKKAKDAEQKANDEVSAREKLEKELSQLKAEKRQLEHKTRNRDISSKNSIIDYGECTTAKRLFEKYNGRIAGNVIVVSEYWTGDYCFVIDEIIHSGGVYKARGTAYLEGEFHKNYTYPAEEECYRMYGGPSVSKINKIHKKRDKVSETSSSLQLEDLAKNLKDYFMYAGFEVIDKRNNGGCLWVVGEESQIDPYLAKARKRFGETCQGKYGSGKSTNYRKAWYTHCKK